MPNWTWLAVGLVGGYLVARHSAGLGFGFSVSASGTAGGGGGSRRRGLGSSPIGERWGSTPYVEDGSWNPVIPGGFPDLDSPADAGRDVTGGYIT